MTSVSKMLSNASSSLANYEPEILGVPLRMAGDLVKRAVKRGQIYLFVLDQSKNKSVSFVLYSPKAIIEACRNCKVVWPEKK